MFPCPAAGPHGSVESNCSALQPIGRRAPMAMSGARTAMRASGWNHNVPEIRSNICSRPVVWYVERVLVGEFRPASILPDIRSTWRLIAQVLRNLVGSFLTHRHPDPVVAAAQSFFASSPARCSEVLIRPCVSWPNEILGVPIGGHPCEQTSRAARQ
jgi:hypothetical protein